MTDYEIVEMCRRAGAEFPQDYMEPGWIPHAWVKEAVEEAFERGFHRGRIDAQLEFQSEIPAK
jgi:hypothetical protein